MKISGFTFVKNATKIYYPVKAVISSALPIVDEFIVALGPSDEDDHTRQEIESLNSDKIRIIDTEWDTETYQDGTVYAQQTDLAKNHCTGDWCFYLQADEVVHEKYHAEIISKCKRFLVDPEVEGFLFNYRHFWGDFDHYVNSHGWYPKEIRIVRNDPGIHSWGDAQSFRRIRDFDGKSYRQKEGSEKLKVVELDAFIYHYGWVRPPHLMQKKRKAMESFYHEAEKVKEMFENAPVDFDYGDLSKLPKFKGTHPRVMKEWMEKSNWQQEMEAARKNSNRRKKHKHEKLKNRLLTVIEQKLLGGRQLFGYSNWEKLNK